jgi:hypothetical protein
VWHAFTEFIEKREDGCVCTKSSNSTYVACLKKENERTLVGVCWAQVDSKFAVVCIRKSRLDWDESYDLTPEGVEISMELGEAVLSGVVPVLVWSEWSEAFC